MTGQCRCGQCRGGQWGCQWHWHCGGQWHWDCPSNIPWGLRQLDISALDPQFGSTAQHNLYGPFWNLKIITVIPHNLLQEYCIVVHCGDWDDFAALTAATKENNQ